MNLAEIAQAVLGFCAQDGVLLTDDLTPVEEAVVGAVRRIGAKAVEVHLGRQKLGLKKVSGTFCAKHPVGPLRGKRFLTPLS